MAKTIEDQFSEAISNLASRYSELRASESSVSDGCRALVNLHAGGLKLEGQLSAVCLLAAKGDVFAEPDVLLEKLGNLKNINQRIRASLKDNAYHFDAALKGLIAVRKAAAKFNRNAQGAWHLHDVLSDLTKRETLPKGVTSAVLAEAVETFNNELADGCFKGAKGSFCGWWSTSALGAIKMPDVELETVHKATA